MENIQYNSQAIKFLKQTGESQIKYKTEICRSWDQGFCEYGDKCIFAHGYKEIRNSPSLINYKTKKCKQFHEIGYCQYGNRCQFLHKSSSEESNIIHQEKPKDNSKKRLPVFLKLAPQDI